MDTLSNIALKLGHRKQECFNFLKHYDNILNHLRDSNITFFEIGIGGSSNINDGGHSLRMWGEYFSKAKLFALDIYKKNLIKPVNSVKCPFSFCGCGPDLRINKYA